MIFDAGNMWHTSEMHLLNDILFVFYRIIVKTKEDGGGEISVFQMQSAVSDSACIV